MNVVGILTGAALASTQLEGMVEQQSMLRKRPSGLMLVFLEHKRLGGGSYCMILSGSNPDP